MLRTRCSSGGSASDWPGCGRWPSGSGQHGEGCGPSGRWRRSTATHLQRLEALWSGRYRRRLVPALASLRDAGLLELIASGATHGFLPRSVPSPEAVHAQVAVGVAEHTRALGAPPSGFWLPDAALPGVERVLAGERPALHLPRCPRLVDALSPARCARCSAPAFTALRGGCLRAGTPRLRAGLERRAALPSADPLYRDFYRDAGWDLPLPALVTGGAGRATAPPDR